MQLKNLLLRKVIAIVITSLALVNIVKATNYYVDPATGNISADGSKGTPWSTLAEVITAGKTLIAGDTIFLKSGNHGFPVISQENTADVVIAAYSGHTPIINRIEFSNSKHWVLEGVSVYTTSAPPEAPVLSHPVYPKSGNFLVKIDNSDSITISNCYIYSIENSSAWTEDDWNYKAWNGISITNGVGMVTKNCLIKNINFAINFSSTSGNLTQYNTIKNFCGDALRTTSNSTLEYNEILDAYNTNGNHDDAIQGFATSNVILRGNKIINTTSSRDFISSLQGMGLFDGFFDNYTIENNLVVVNAWHGISLYGARNCKIMNNTVAKNPFFSSTSQPWIAIYNHKDNSPSTDNIIKNNITPAINSAIGSVDSNNIVTTNYTAHFVDYNNLDFHLRALSTAVNAGSSTDAPTIDLDEATRTLPYDVGCYEFVNNSSDVTAPSVPTNLDTVKVELSSADLIWNASTDDVGVLGYRVYTDGKNPIVALDTTATITDLNPETTYTFTATTVDSAGNESAPSAEIIVTTPKTGPVYSSNSWQSFTISEHTDLFTATFDVIPLDEGGGMDATVGILNGTANSYSDLACIVRFYGSTIEARNGGSYSADTTLNYALYETYHFRMVIDVLNHKYNVFVTPDGNNEIILAKEFAFRTEQNSVTSLNGWATLHITGLIQIDGLTFSPGGVIGDKEAPSIPTGLTASEINATSIKLKWNASTDNDKVGSYKIYVINNNDTATISTANADTVKTITGLKPETEYIFKVAALDLNLNESDASDPLTETLLADTEAPSIPTDLAASNITATSVTLSWDASIDNYMVSNYKIYTINNSDTIIKTVYSNSLETINGLNQYTKYTFKVSALDSSLNESSMSDGISVTTLDSLTPNAPTGLQVTNVTSTSLSLSWNASSDNDTVTKYIIYALTNNDTIEFTTSFSNKKIIADLKPNTEYTFKVTALDSSQNESDMSASITGTTLISSITSPVLGNVKVYPNPLTSDNLNIELNDYKNNLLQITISDITGKAVYNELKNITANSISIPLKNLNSGIYILQLKGNNFVKARKLIVE